MSSNILENAKAKIAKFNDIGLHYNLVPDQIHKERSAGIDPFDKYFLRYIIAGLIAWDMRQYMGKTVEIYDFESNGFASRLNSKLLSIKPLLLPLMNLDLLQVDLMQNRSNIVKAYDDLSAKGPGALHNDKTKSFHVGATKILHFLNPSLFVIVDSNAARAFRLAHDIPFKDGTQPGYSADRYMECMKYARCDISEYGLETFQALEPHTPITRIYDKLTFATGAGLISPS